MPRKTPRKTRARVARKPAFNALTALGSVRANAAGALGGLIERGAALQERGRKLAVAGTRQAREAVLAGATRARLKAADTVSRVERVFEDRVTGVISRLGVPTARDVRALSRQVAHLQQSVDQLRRVRAR